MMRWDGVRCGWSGDVVWCDGVDGCGVEVWGEIWCAMECGVMWGGVRWGGVSCGEVWCGVREDVVWCGVWCGVW